MKILNSKGEEIILNAREAMVADVVQRQTNSLGYEINITTLTTIVKKITEQKFFEIPPADYLPLRVGEGAWSSNLVTYKSSDISGKFEDGIMNTGANEARMANADAGIDSQSIKVINWAKGIQWSLFDLQLASKSGNWDLVTAKEKSRKRNWDLGIQRVAFLGARGDNGSTGQCLGLLNQPGVNINTDVITQSIKSMTEAQLKVLCANILEAYRSNCERTAWPTHWIIPESDYNGLASQASATYPIKSVIQILEETMQTITRNKSFKILPLAYGDAAYHADVAAIAGKQVYVLLNYDEESVRMDLPVDYTNTLANSTDNFNFQNVGYGQFTGVGVYRPKEMLYFQY